MDIKDKSFLNYIVKFFFIEFEKIMQKTKKTKFSCFRFGKIKLNIFEIIHGKKNDQKRKDK